MDKRREQLKQIIEERIEFLSTEQIESESDYTTLFDRLEYFYQHPISLNNCNADDLSGLGLLNEIQINNLLLHIEKHGKLLAIEELQSIDGFDLESIQMIRPFCKLIENEAFPNPSWNQVIEEGKHTFLLRHSRVLENQKGYLSDGAYLGSQDKLYSRYRFQYANRLSIGISAEKDAGEQFLKRDQKTGFDFYSAHLFIRNVGKVHQLAIGDFQAQFGQGLTYWSGLAFNGGLGIGSLKRIGNGISPYTSIQEDNFLRGIGISMQQKSWTYTAFISSKKLDANIDEDENGNQIVTSFGGNGFHRTKNEIEKRKKIAEFQTGGHIRYSHKRIQLGFTLALRKLDGSLEKDDKLDKLFNSSKNSLLNYGTDYSYSFRNFLIYGEIAKQSDGGFATLNGLLWVVAKNFQLGVLQRNYSRNFQNIHNNAIGTNSKNSNEKGTSLNMDLKVSRKWKLSSNLDLYQFPWLRYQLDAPSRGLAYTFQLNYQASKEMLIYFRYRERARDKHNPSIEQGTEKLIQEIGRNYRIHFQYQISEEIRIQNRIEIRQYRLGNVNESGFLVYQDLKYKKLNFPLSFSIRYALFETPSYQSRIYAYENDVLYAFSIPAYSGIGNRFYVLLQWRIKKGIDFWLRFDQTAYLHKDSIGSGNELIEGNKRSQIKSQLRFTF